MRDIVVAVISNTVVIVMSSVNFTILNAFVVLAHANEQAASHTSDADDSRKTLINKLSLRVFHASPNLCEGFDTTVLAKPSHLVMPTSHCSAFSSFLNPPFPICHLHHAVQLGRQFQAGPNVMARSLSEQKKSAQLQKVRAKIIAAAPTGSRSFLFAPKADGKPMLVLISGCTGTGKSTFGMSVALDLGILKCISTDTVRAVMRSFVSKQISPSLHQSSYQGQNDPVEDWRTRCAVLETSIEALVTDAINRGVSLVLEGVHVVPSNKLIKRWEESGGVALGCLLTIPDEDAHRSVIFRRGEVTTKGESKKLQSFDRIRAIHTEMIRLAEEANWMQVEQKLEPDPLERIAMALKGNQRSPILAFAEGEQFGTPSTSAVPGLTDIDK
eukprot:gnl/MRDRNA2_/MRDRNA2_19197_c0_seq1.p1 gnl/MRDRNA2_/MRDRNA2_19197_c0~~gnl/MRDRNA2_/MRDRNA2_19197_c0_seq1.p1  ORF type:complete len:385 (+),score=55.88 gnl/MRDRNA2_/MRDRNA2_19197_c0_seq1:70-1224(+)